VGSWRTGDLTGPYAARWDGTRWTDETAAVTGGAGAGWLYDVSCRGSACAVAGAGPDDHVVVLTSTGGAWTALPSTPVYAPAEFPTSPGRVQLSCAAASFCGLTAAGLWPTTTVWDGARWSEAVASQTTAFLDISCPTAGRCVAVGVTTRGGARATWQAGGWTFERLDRRLAAVSCAGPDRCVALAGEGIPGSGGPEALTGAQVRIGGAWRAGPGTAPPVPSDATVASVSCTRAGCMAVGGTLREPVAYRWTF
jgi:hypothetical protein